MARNRYDMDEILEDSFDVNQLKRLTGYIAPYKKKMAGVILLMLSLGTYHGDPDLFPECDGSQHPGKRYEIDHILQYCDIADRTLFGYFPADQDQDHECDRAEYRT